MIVYSILNRHEGDIEQSLNNLIELIDDVYYSVDKVYIHMSEVVYSNHENDFTYKFDLYVRNHENIEIRYWKEVDGFCHMSLYPMHFIDQVIMVNDDHLNDSIIDDIKDVRDRCIYNVRANYGIRRRVYNNNMLSYTNIDNSESYKESINDVKDFKNIVNDEVYIPCKIMYEETSIEELRKEYFNNFTLFLTMFCFDNGIDVYHFDKNPKYENENIDYIIYSYLACHKNMLERWKNEYSNYRFIEAYHFNINTINKNNVDLGIIMRNIPEMVIENINQVNDKLLSNIENIYILDNSDKKELVILNQRNKIASNIKHKTIIIDNTDDKYFKRIEPFKFDEDYGFEQYEQSVRYMIEKSNCNYLYILNDKIVVNEVILFDDSNILNEYGNYIKVFNIKLMKKHNIHFTTFKEFRQKAEELNLRIGNIVLNKNIITIPDDFDKKYSSTVFRNCRLRYYILRNYIIDNYGVNLGYDRDWLN